MVIMDIENKDQVFKREYVYVHKIRFGGGVIISKILGRRGLSNPNKPLLYAIDLGSCFLGKYHWDYWGGYRGGAGTFSPPPYIRH